MPRKMKRVLTLLLVVLMFFGILGGCAKKPAEGEKPTGQNEPTKKVEEPIILTVATHNVAEMDPDWKDPVTGKNMVMSPSKQEAARKAAETLKKELNVEFKYIKFPNNIVTDLLKSVLANDPIADIARTWTQGTLLNQNVVQKLDEYKGMFDDEDTKWMMADKMFGSYYFLSCDIDFLMAQPLLYNITYLEKVDTLKSNGKTILPTDIWKEGKWTWSAFEEYLTKVKNYYANKKAPVRKEINIEAYQTMYQYTALEAILSNGGNLYGVNGVGVDSKETKEGVAYVENLISKGLVVSTPTYNPSQQMKDFGNGEMVFSDISYWNAPKVGDSLSQRGEAMGIVPFPRPDNMPEGDKRYRQLQRSPGNVCIPKGVSKEKTKLCVEAFKLYYSEYYKNLGGTDKALDYFNKKNAEAAALLTGIDVTNEVYGSDMVDAYMAYNPQLVANEYVSVAGWEAQWNTLLKNALFGLNGSSKYALSIESEKGWYYDQIERMKEALSGDKIIDTIAPNISLVGKDVAFPKGTDVSKIDWSKYIKASDNIDGEIDINSVTIDSSKIKFDTVGKYDKGLVVSVKDKQGNEKKSEINTVIFDPNNKTAPTITAKAGYRNIKLNEDVSKIKWEKDFVDKALSSEGFDIKNYISADVTKLDITKAGKYDVTLNVVDYAGNKGELKITVTVA